MNIVGSSEKCYFEEFMTDHLKRINYTEQAFKKKRMKEKKHYKACN
jgi:hypothetical protein